MIQKKSLLKVIGVLAVFSIGAMGASMRSQFHSERFTLTVDRQTFAEISRRLTAFGEDVAGVDLRKGLIYVVVDAKTKDSALALARTLNLPEIRESRLMAETPDIKYKTPAQIESILHNYEKKFPGIAEVKLVGTSVEGRQIWAMHIGNRSTPVTPKPAILFNGMHHAREVMSVEVPLDIIEYLVTKYDSDPQVKKWIDTNDIYVLPMLNVDGSNRVWTSDAWWRKNTHNNDGVDLNRNYPYAWNSCNGSSDSPTAEDYHGPSPASEPETLAMMKFVQSIKPIFDISFHSYSEIVIYPYGCGNHTETAQTVESIGKKLASLIKTDDGQSTYTAGTAPELLYLVDGADIDWMYHEQKVIPFVIEVNSGNQGFQPAFDQWRDSTVARVRPAWQYLLDQLEHGRP